MVGCQKCGQYIRMLCPGRFILIESVSVRNKNTVIACEFGIVLCLPLCLSVSFYAFCLHPSLKWFGADSFMSSWYYDNAEPVGTGSFGAAEYPNGWFLCSSTLDKQVSEIAYN